MSVRRLILGQLTLDAKKPIYTPQGFLQAPADIARTGIQIYRRADGTERREWRPASEVFHPDSLASFQNAPVTYVPKSPNNHPPDAVTSSNARVYASGLVTGDVKQNGTLVSTVLTIMHEDAIKAALDGTASGISNGYGCDLDMTPGVVPEGERDAGQHYDGVQRNIRGNHVAQVHPSIARAGFEARMHLDANDNAVSEAAHTPQEGTMKIRIAGVEQDVTDTVGQLIEKERADAAALLAAETKLKTDAVGATAAVNVQLAEAKTKVETEKARADANAEKLTKAEKARTDAEDPKALQAKITARVDLETKARAILGDDAKLSDKTDAEVKLAVVAKAHPDLKLDGKDPQYIAARFDLAVETAEDAHPMDPVRRAALARKDAEDEDEDREDAEPDVDAARKQMLKDRRDASKPAKA